MARDHARLDLYIWNDDDFRALSTPAKLVYLNLFSLPKLSYAGVLDLAVKRWARAHPDLGIDGVRAALAELDAARFVVIDHDTEELLVRSFIRRDELWKQPNMLRGALRVAFDIESPILRAALAVELRRLPAEITGPAPAVAAAELATGAREITAAVKVALTVRGNGRPTPTPAAVDPMPPLDTDADTTAADTTSEPQNPSSNPSPNPAANPSPTPSAMDLGEGSRERGTSRSPVPVDRKVGVPAPAGVHPRVPARVSAPAHEARPTPEDTALDRAPGSVRTVRQLEAERLVSVHAPAQPRRVLQRLRGEVIGLLAEGTESAVIAAGLRMWASKRLAVSFLPELVGEHMRATLAASGPEVRRRAVAAAEAFELIRADAIADDDRSPVGLAVRGELPAHADPADLDALLVAAFDTTAALVGGNGMTRTRAVVSVTRSEARALLTHYRLAGPAPITDDLVTAWTRDLRGYSAGECHAALVAMASHRNATITPAEITTRIDSARANPTTPTPHAQGRNRHRDRDRAGERARAEAAGARGIRTVYAAMGWDHHPDRDRALTVRCRFCRAAPGRVCTPMVRNRAGQRESRDPDTGMHLSRMADAHAANREQAR